HFSVARAAFLLGLDAEAVVTVPTDAAGRMDAEALRASLLAIEANGAIPMAVVATAGTTDLGVIDPLEPIAEVCEAANVWLHVDAAYGGRPALGPAPSPPARRDRAGRLGDHRLPQDVLPAGVVLGAAGQGREPVHPDHPPPRLPQPRGRGAVGRGRTEPGRQIPADHPPLRRAQALGDAAGPRLARDRRDDRHRVRPGR